VLSVTRQLYYGMEHSKSLDLVLSLNGVPVATAELKNPLSGQTVEDAQKQYKKHRDQLDPLFEFTKPTFVHFAVNQDSVSMTMRLSAVKPHFLLSASAIRAAITLYSNRCSKQYSLS
jgi:type I restriction enzyme R subunit